MKRSSDFHGSGRNVVIGAALITVALSVSPAWAGIPWLNLFQTLNTLPQVADDATFSTVTPAIDPTDTEKSISSIRISPALGGRSYVWVDGSTGPAAVWQNKAAWGTRVVPGPIAETTCTLAARACGSTPGICASAYGDGASMATLFQVRSINTGADGIAINRGIMGNATRLDAYSWSAGSEATLRIWEIAEGTSVRGIAGGMDADTYNWRDMSGQGVGHTGTPGPLEPTTLMWMRNVRDYGAALPVVTVNTRGTGPLESSGWCRFYYTDTSIAPLVARAQDWVRYINHILPTYRDGDTLPAGDQAILDSIDWYGRPKLPAVGEAATPHVEYWEIGNEPELALPWCTADMPKLTITAAEYAERYKQISAAMLAIDPLIKVGPCTIGEDYSGAVLDDPAARVEFVSYHPYGPLAWMANAHGDTTATAESGLRYIKQQQVDRWNNVRSRIASSGRDPDAIQLMASEYNPSSWEWECSGKDRRMAQALGLAETIFTFAELKLLAAHYWSFPTSCSATGEAPMYKVFQMFQEHLGTRLLDSFTDGFNLRIYTTIEDPPGRIAVWVLNLSDSDDMLVRFNLDNLGLVGTITKKKLGNLAGDTSLFDVNTTASPDTIDWTSEDITGTLNPADFTMTFEDATITVLVIAQEPAAPCDFDRDGDVDQEDFGTFQVCLSGAFTAQTDPGCVGALLDGDADVDESDLAKFLNCLTGAELPADPACAD